MEHLLRAQDVAELLNLRSSTVYQLCHRGILPHIRIDQGKRRALIRFRPRDIESFIQSKKRPHPTD